MATLKLNGNTSGYVSLTTNAVAQNNTLTMPDVTDTVATITAPTFLNSVALATTTGTSPGLGLFSPSANVLAFSTSVSERMRIDSAGNVGVATSTPTAPLTVQSSAVIAAGSPAILVQGQSNSERIQIRSASGDPVFAALTARGTQAAPTATQSGDNLGYYQVGGYTGTAYQRNAWMSGIATENWTTSNRGGGLAFSTTPNGSNNIAERMRIDSTGNVGIGSTTPQQTLDVQGNVNVLNTVIMGSSFLRNRLINGAMQVSQRQGTGVGATITSAGAGVFGPDRFWTLASITSVATVFQVATGASDFPYAMRVQRGNGQVSTPILYAGQTIESFNCSDLSGQTITFSFYATAGANYSGGVAAAEIWTGTGTDQGTSSLNNATWTGQTRILNAAFTPSVTRTRYTFTIPVGAGINEMAIRWTWTTSGTAGAADFIDFTGVQLEPGPVATPFERRQYGQELYLCQRYYELLTYNQTGMIATAQAYSTTQAQAPFSWKVPKRAGGATVALSDTSAGVFVIYTAGGGVSNCTYTFNGISADNCWIQISGATGLVAGNAALLYNNAASSKSISISLEL